MGYSCRTGKWCVISTASRDGASHRHLGHAQIGHHRTAPPTHASLALSTRVWSSTCWGSNLIARNRLILRQGSLLNLILKRKRPSVPCLLAVLDYHPIFRQMKVRYTRNFHLTHFAASCRIRTVHNSRDCQQESGSAWRNYLGFPEEGHSSGTPVLKFGGM